MHRPRARGRERSATASTSSAPRLSPPSQRVPTPTYRAHLRPIKYHMTKPPTAPTVKLSKNNQESAPRHKTSIPSTPKSPFTVPSPAMPRKIKGTLHHHREGVKTAGQGAASRAAGMGSSAVQLARRRLPTWLHTDAEADRTLNAGRGHGGWQDSAALVRWAGLEPARVAPPDGSTSEMPSGADQSSAYTNFATTAKSK